MTRPLVSSNHNRLMIYPMTNCHVTTNVDCCSTSMSTTSLSTTSSTTCGSSLLPP